MQRIQEPYFPVTKTLQRVCKENQIAKLKKSPAAPAFPTIPTANWRTTRPAVDQRDSKCQGDRNLFWKVYPEKPCKQPGDRAMQPPVVFVHLHCLWSSIYVTIHEQMCRFINLLICMSIYVVTCIICLGRHTFTYIHSHAYTYTYIHIHTCIYIYAFLPLSLSICIYTWLLRHVAPCDL